MTNPDISCFYFNKPFPSWFEYTMLLLENGIDLLKKLRHNSLELIIPSISNMFFMPRTKSTFSCTSDNIVNISNL